MGRGGYRMKVKSEMVTGDGFDKNVAEKMPKIRKLEEPLSTNLEVETWLQKEGLQETMQEVRPAEKEVEKKSIFEPQKKGTETEQNLDVLKLIEDLHTQLLASARTKRAQEMDLTSQQKTIHQLAQDNQALRRQLEGMNEELQRLKKIQSESIYLEEENTDALEKIQEFQQELSDLKETLVQTTQERNEALHRISELESQIEQNEILKIKGRLKEREASYLFEEGQELQAKLEEALAQNMDLENKYQVLRKSFNEVRESLALLRDSCKKDYYNLSEIPE
jgi:DNA repair exonuclease SbcCD ATPase subunit